MPKHELAIRSTPNGRFTISCLTDRHSIKLVGGKLGEAGEPDIESLAIAHDRLIDLSLAARDERYDALAMELTEMLRDRVFADVVRQGPNVRFANHLLGWEELEDARIGHEVMNA